MSNPAAQALSKVKGFKLASLGWFGGLMGREFQDHKVAFFWVPAVLAGFMIFGTFANAIVGHTFISELGLLDNIKDGNIVINGRTEGTMEDAAYMMEKFNSIEIDAMDRALGFFTILTNAVFMMAIPLVVLFTLLGSLYDDRRDRSFLFWKSMPVSDTSEVLSKLFASTVMGPAVIIAFAALSQLVWMLVGTVQGYIYGVGELSTSFIWGQLPTISIWFGMLGMVILGCIWALPIIGWLMFVSATAKKAALMVATVPIAAISVMELVFFKSSIFIKFIVERLIGWFVDLDGIDFHRIENAQVEFTDPFIGGSIDRLMEGMATGEFWFSAAIGVAFIYGAIYMRRHNTA